jgi:type II secretory pathway component GspD/PulD (secretin)
VIPYVQADGYTIQMTVLPSLKEFLGYEDPKLVQPAGAGAAQYKGVSQPVPLPKFRLRQTSTTARIFDGQTIMIGAGTARDYFKSDRDTNGVITTNYTDKALFFFVTPRLIDPAGNPLHSNEELRKLHQQGSPDTKGIDPSDPRKSGLRKTAEPQRP